MERPPRRPSFWICLVALISLISCAPTGQAPSAVDVGSKTWIGREREVEQYMRTAECVSLDEFSKMPDAKRCNFRPGGPVARMIWKPFPPTVYRGFRESPKANIAAYELDKLLKLNMLPPSVERELQGYKGTAIFWVEKITDAENAKPPTGPSQAYRDEQLTRIRMFDALIGNRDRNQGNILVDSAWNMILLDHTRAFGSGTDIPSMDSADKALWERIESLTRDQLNASLGPWLEEEEIAAILARRDKMKAAVSKR